MFVIWQEVIEEQVVEEVLTDVVTMPESDSVYLDIPMSSIGKSCLLTMFKYTQQLPYEAKNEKKLVWKMWLSDFLFKLWQLYI